MKSAMQDKTIDTVHTLIFPIFIHALEYCLGKRLVRDVVFQEDDICLCVYVPNRSERSHVVTLQAVASGVGKGKKKGHGYANKQIVYGRHVI